MFKFFEILLKKYPSILKMSRPDMQYELKSLVFVGHSPSPDIFEKT